jgi:hypothetical protein
MANIEDAARLIGLLNEAGKICLPTNFLGLKLHVENEERRKMELNRDKMVGKVRVF